MKLYGELNKVEPQDDGTIKVWGTASAETADSVGEIITAAAMKSALPEYMKFGAVREMHQQSAAGTAISAEVTEDGKTIFGAHVVDPIAVKKIQTGVYKGFSVGGRVKKRDTMNKNLITEILLSEISLVDRPCHPDAVFDIYKADNMKKSMYDIGYLADLLSSLNNLRQGLEWEAEYEQDGSAIPAKLKTAVNDLAAILQELVKEETAEMTSKTEKSDQITPDPNKKEVFKYPPNGLNTPAEISPSQNPVNPDYTEVKDATKASVSEDLAKSQQMNDVLSKMLDMSEQLNKALTQNTALEKRISELEKQPLQPKAALRGEVIEKSDDTKRQKEDEINEDDPLELIKAVHVGKI